MLLTSISPSAEWASETALWHWVLGRQCLFLVSEQGSLVLQSRKTSVFLVIVLFLEITVPKVEQVGGPFRPGVSDSCQCPLYSSGPKQVLGKNKKKASMYIIPCKVFPVSEQLPRQEFRVAGEPTRRSFCCPVPPLRLCVLSIAEQNLYRTYFLQVTCQITWKTSGSLFGLCLASSQRHPTWSSPSSFLLENCSSNVLSVHHVHLNPS